MASYRPTCDRTQLLAEEAHLARALSMVRSKLNALQPVSYLPTEILEAIFDICVSWLYGHHKPKHRLAWTQVCSSWRQISLNSSRLWQRIDLCDSRFADEFLVRSKEAPLSIVSASPLRLATDNLSLHANRLRCIDVFLFSDDIVRLFSYIGPTLPSSVTHLSLKVPPKSQPLALDLEVPNVRYLSLDCAAVKWTSCQQLIHLSIRGLTPQLCPSVTELHDILEASPDVEFVRLEDLTPSDIEMEPQRAIRLTNLKDMIITAQPNTASAVLSGLLLGGYTRLQLFVSLSQPLHTLFPNELPYLHNSVRFDTSTVRLARHGAHFLRSGSEQWSEDAQKTIFSISSAPPLGTRVCSSLSRLLDLSRVTSLELNTGLLFDVPMKDIERLFASMDNLDTLRVAFNELAELLECLQADASAQGRACVRDALHEARPRVCLPRLRTLSFSKPVDFWYHFSERWLEHIVRCAKARHAHGAPIEVIEFFRCNGVTSESATQLREFVGKVVVTSERPDCTRI